MESAGLGTPKCGPVPDQPFAICRLPRGHERVQGSSYVGENRAMHLTERIGDNALIDTLWKIEGSNGVYRY